jgi:hypothetical protein
MPFKANADRRHHIPKQKRRVTNWAAYDASLRQRRSLTVWFTEEAIVAWRAAPRTTRGGQPWYSPLAILTALTLNAVVTLSFEGVCFSLDANANPATASSVREAIQPRPGHTWPA